MKTIVTGGAGFIGSHLVERLLAAGHYVTVLDNLSTGNRDNVRLFAGNKRYRFIKLDITDESADLTKIITGGEWIFHLAALADIVPSVVNPAMYHQANVTGTIRVLEACRLAGVKKVVYAASGSCYGIPDTYPTPESSVIKPQYPYALTKWAGEQYVLHWSKAYKLPVVSLRLFNVYGPRSRSTGTYGAVFGIFLAQKLAGKPYTVVGDGTQMRDFTFVTDVVDAFIRAAESRVSSEVFNVGTGKPSSINELVRLLKGPVVYIPKRPGEPDKTQADIRKIKKMLGWQPKVTFEEGVAKILENINYWSKAPVWSPEKIKHVTREWYLYLK